MTKNFILIGAKPPKGQVANPGGQLTASIGVVDYIESLGFTIDVIDTTQSSFPVPPLKERLLKGLSRTKLLFKLLRDKPINGVIIFSSSGFSFYERIVQSFVCKFYKVPDVFFIRSGHFMNAIKRSRFQRTLARGLLKIPTRLGVQGRAWVPFYQSLGIKKENTVLVRNWLQANFPVATEPKVISSDRAVSFVFVGWLVKAKGVVQLLEAIAELKDKYPFEVHLVGGGTLENYCAQYKKDNGLGDFLHLHGWQEKENVLKIVNNSDVFILPSDAEGFPNSLLEAMALGLPVICTNVGGVSDSLLDGVNGFLLESNDFTTISKAMEKYLVTPEIIPEQSLSSLSIYKENHDRRQNCEILLNQFINE